MGRSRLPHPRRRYLIAPRPRLRAARPGDGPGAYAVFHAAVHQGAASAYTADERAAWAPHATAPTPARWEQRLLAAHTVVATLRGRIIGFMTLGGDGHIDLAYVAPDWMGRGVADALYDAILRLARDAGMPVLSTEASLLARSFFARHNWRVIARQSVIRHGVALTNFRMEYDVSSSPAGSK
ncbi:MAG: GNAT family N-acetyltransferase [Rhodobacteraceae bacterium]|nr:GNAT family N-acetyltransferase [Paracoccaceae bacterium]